MVFIYQGRAHRKPYLPLDLRLIRFRGSLPLKAMMTAFELLSMQARVRGIKSAVFLFSTSYRLPAGVCVLKYP